MTSFLTSFGTVKVIKLRETLAPKIMGTGGLRMIDVKSFSKALKCVWIRKNLDESNKGKWKPFF